LIFLWVLTDLGTVKPKIPPMKVSVVVFQYPDESMAGGAPCLQRACQEIATEETPREMKV